jgi:hypothetical protein
MSMIETIEEFSDLLYRQGEKVRRHLVRSF